MKHLSSLKKLRSVKELIANEGWKTVMVIAVSACPSCGVKEIYDGSFTGKKIPGMGVYAKMVSETSIKLIDVEDLD